MATALQYALPSQRVLPLSEPLRVFIADDAHADTWNEFVDRQPDATLFHGWMWRGAVRCVFGHEPFYLIAQENGRVVGVLPLFLVRSLLAGRLLVSVPYAVYGGPLVEGARAAGALREAVCEIAERHRVRRIEIRSVRAAWPDLPVIDDRYVTFQKPLPKNEADVLAELPRKARAAARNARNKYGLTVTRGDEQVREVWLLYSRSMRRLGSPNYPFRFFSELLERTPERHVVTVVRQDGKPAAGLVSFVYRDTLMPYFAGCDERLERFSPNNLLYLSAMEWGVNEGLRRFDFGRSRRNNRGSFDFKRHQGFEPKPLCYQVWTPQGRPGTELTPDNARLQWAIRMWRRMPLWMTRPLGAYTARSIPG